MPTPKVWFITGASSGFGRAVTETVLKNGDIAVATLRKPSAIADLSKTYPDSRLLVVTLDVRDTEAIKAAFLKATEKFGRVDVVFNNAGYTLFGEAEGTPEENARKQLEVNFWGVANVTREAVRVLREVNNPPGGFILQNASMSVFIGVPLGAYYAASKAAIEAFSTSVQLELDPAWGIKITSMEAGTFKTGVLTTGIDLIPVHPAYSEVSAGFRGYLASEPFKGDVVKAAEAIHKLGHLPDPPKHFPLGNDALAAVRGFAEGLKGDADRFETWSKDVGC